MKQLILIVAVVISFLPPTSARNLFADYNDVEHVLRVFANVLPTSLKTSSSLDQSKAWTEWVTRHDREVRERLQGGDEDTLVNWLLFGTSFTHEPRLLFDISAESAGLPRLLSRRVRDFIAFLRQAQSDDRSIFAHGLIRSQGYAFDSAVDRTKLEQHLQKEVERVLAERRQYALREDSFRPGDFAGQMMAQSTLFRDRGLSLDTSILPDFAIEQALEAMKKQGVLQPNSIRRIAVIGPGLDFADKNSGFDFYPVQTLQPFTVIDSLARLGLTASLDDVQLTTLDISARVNDHILAAQNRGKSGSPYVLRLPMDIAAQWTPVLVSYWKHAGDLIGSETPLPRPPDLEKRFEVRAIEVRPRVVARVSAEDFNVVTERWPGPPFDLVIATNVLVYYDKLDQSLAFASIETMLRQGGLFLTNNAVVELPTSQLRSLGFVTVEHSRDKVDHVFWYRRNER
jgi:hypothetical protein